MTISRSTRAAATLCCLLATLSCAHRPTQYIAWPSAVQEYVLPDTAAFPNDIAVGADGDVWYTDRLRSRVARLDPETGVVTQYDTPTPASAPYGITVADDGAVWYAGSRAGVLGRVDPATGEITEHPVGGGGPHGVVAVGDRIWFTMRRSGGYGWLDRSTGERRIFEFLISAGHSGRDQGPYALVAAGGSLWFTAMGEPALFQISERNGALQRIELGVRGWPRRLAVGADGDVWYSNFPRGRLGRLSARSGKVEEIPLVRTPAEPYGIAVDPHGRVWVNEARNDRMMGYDPATDEFRALTIPTPGATVRHIAVDAERRRIWLPLSGTHRIGRIDLPPPERIR